MRASKTWDLKLLKLTASLVLENIASDTITCRRLRLDVCLQDFKKERILNLMNVRVNVVYNIIIFYNIIIIISERELDSHSWDLWDNFSNDTLNSFQLCRLKYFLSQDIYYVGFGFQLKLSWLTSGCPCVMSVLTTGKHVAVLSCLRLCLGVRVELLKAYGSPDWIQDHWALVDGDVTRPTDGVGRRTPDRSLVVWRYVIQTVCVKLEHTKCTIRVFIILWDFIT